jgi:nitrogen fixation protein FixH
MLKSYFRIILVLLSLFICFAPTSYAARSKQNSIAFKEVYKKLPKAGKKISIGGGSYFVYRLDTKAKKRTVAVNLEIYDSSSNRIKISKITGEMTRASVKDAKPIERSFKINEYKEYVLPVEGLAAGKWIVKLNLYMKNKVVYKGQLKIKV